jgi:hypothetical protein
MATIQHVESLLRNLQIKEIQSDGGAFTVRYRDAFFLLSNADVDDYLSAKATIERSVPPAVCRPSLFEQAVEVQGHGPATYRLFRDRDCISMTDRGGTRQVSLSPASVHFALAQLDVDEFATDLRQIISFGYMRSRRSFREDANVPQSLDSLFSRILTIKVATSADDPIARNCRKLQTIAEAALFHIAYGQGIGFSLSRSWERAYYRLGLRRESEVQFPVRTYISELLAYYHLAFGSDSLILAYLALYKVMEYFFTSSSDRVLHAKMIEKLVEPDFSHAKTKKLQELARVIRTHDNKLDERRLLRTVLEHHFDVDELRKWVVAYDSNHESYLTTEHAVFAETLKVDVSDEQLFSSVANRIYHIRNALVHHKEGEVSRFIPFSGQEEILYRELPLLLFLAEQVIIKTGKDI